LKTASFKVNLFIRSNIATLKPYTPIVPFEVLSQQLGRQPEEIIKLDANENPYGPSPLVAETLGKAAYLHIYPDPESRDLRAALAEYTGVKAESLLVGSGADELIDLVMRLFIEPGDMVINCPPTFGMYAFDAGVNGAAIINIWRDQNFSIALEKIESLFIGPNPPFQSEVGQKEKQPKLIFVTSPNNPDGSLLEDDELRRLLALPVLVVLDEAYVEFSCGSRIRWVEQYNNLIVLRTFSKWAGLAGLRVGYGAFPADIIEHLWKIKQPYNVTVAGQIAAQVSLADHIRLMDNVARIIEQREQFYQALAQFDWLRPYPSQANFILCQVVGKEAVKIKQRLAEQGVLVRYYNSPGLTSHLRFSIGTPAQMARLEETLKKL
jgi:histidinol-phosphate aminotransferase